MEICMYVMYTGQIVTSGSFVLIVTGYGSWNGE